MRSHGEQPAHRAVIDAPRPTAARLACLWIVLAAGICPASAAAGEAGLEASILRAKPGVVLISSEVIVYCD